MMGLLIDSSLLDKNYMGDPFLKHVKKICFTLYVIGVVWFFCLANLNFNFPTYISEKSLIVGAASSDMNLDSVILAEAYRKELNQEIKKYKSDIPIPWLIAKMRKIGLETYVHNFTLNVPFSTGKTYHGRNIYGILRAPKTTSAEGIVISTTYRPPKCSIKIADSIPVLLAIAENASKKIYWSKDLIFLITDYEQLGLLAWLNAYYNTDVMSENDAFLKTSKLQARSGSLQTAINLEIQSLRFRYINLKLEGLNGRLPNLDLYNLIHSYSWYEEITSGYRQMSEIMNLAQNQSYNKNLADMISMVLSTASGRPTGLHGLFLKHRIESLTLEAIKFERKSNVDQNARLSFLVVIDKILRTLNNLTERMHASFFYYILIGCDRYVSIGDYIPCIILLAGSLIIKAYILWCGLNKPKVDESNKKFLTNFSINEITKICGISIFFGLISRYVLLDDNINSFFAFNDALDYLTLPTLLAVLSITAGFIPRFIRLSEAEYEILHFITLTYIGTALIVIGLLNFSLGFLLSVFIVPIGIFIDSNYQKQPNFFKIIYLLILQPLVAVMIIEFVGTVTRYPELNFTNMAIKSFETTVDAINTSASDLIIYNNWVFTVWSLILFPAWILCWVLIYPKKKTVSSKN